MGGIEHNGKNLHTMSSEVLEGLKAWGKSELGPENLRQVVLASVEAWESGQLDRSLELLRDSLGILVRLFAALTVRAVFLVGAELAPEIRAKWSPEAEVPVCAYVLICNLDTLYDYPADRLASSLRDIFFELALGATRPVPREFTQRLVLREGLEGLAASTSISWFCSQSSFQESDMVKLGRDYMGLLWDWLSHTEGFWTECDFRIVPGRDYGRREVVVVYRQYILRTGLTVRLNELRRGGTWRGISAEKRRQVAELGAFISALGDERAVDGSSLPDGHSQEQDLGKGGVASGERCLGGGSEGQPQISSASDESAGTKLQVSHVYKGYAKYGQGKYGHGGTIYLYRLDGQPVSGVIRTSDPRIRVEPVVFGGKDVRLTYWVDKSLCPSLKGYIIIVSGSGQYERRIRIRDLVPRSFLASLKIWYGAALMFAPGIISSLYSAYVWKRAVSVLVSFSRGMRPYLSQIEFGQAQLFGRSSGISDFELHVLPQVQGALLLFLLIAYLVPLSTAKMFKYMTSEQKRKLGWAFVPAMLFPSLFFIVASRTTFLEPPGILNNITAMVDYRSYLVWFVVSNLLCAFYLFLSVSGLLERWLESEIKRMILPVVLSVGFGIGVVWLVYWSLS